MLYHISDNPKLLKLEMRVPQRIFKLTTRKGEKVTEDKQTPRICFCHTIDGCLSALDPMPAWKKYLYVYTPKKEVETIIPTIEQVPDLHITGEVWGIADCSVKRIGKIKIFGCEPLRRNSGKGYRIESGKYKWEWVNKSF